METPLGLAADALRLALLMVIPGLALVLQLRRPPKRLIGLLVYGVSGSILYNILLGALLLHLGLFAAGPLLLLAMAPVAVAAVRWQHTTWAIRQAELSAATLVPALLTGAVVAAVLLLTPLWNFLIAPNMDAGNYEVYGNHYWTQGSFYLDPADLIDRGAEPEWIEAHNTWNIRPESGLGRSAYLPGYPVLLGIFKANFNSALASPGANALLAGLSAMILVAIGLHLVRAPLAVAALALTIFFTPMVFFYAKQIMSEQLGLTGVLLCVYAVLEMREGARSGNGQASSAAAGFGVFLGICLGLMARLDLFLFVPLLAVGLWLLETDAWSSEEPRSAKPFFAWGAFGVVLASSIVALVADPAYLRKVRPSALASTLSPGWFLFAYGLAGATAILAAIGVRPALDRLPAGGTRFARTRLIPGTYALLALGWGLFMLWAGLIRPLGPGPTDSPHDAENLLRLYSVTSPIVFGSLMALTPIAFLTRKRERGLAVTFSVGLALALYASRHSEFDLWWMRRYLHYVVPLTMLVAAGALAQLRQRWRDASSTWMTFAGVGLAALVVVQVVAMQPLLATEINEDVPEMLDDLAELIPEESFVVVVEGNTLIRGLSNVFRSLNDSIVLFDVPLDQIGRAAELAPEGRGLVVVSPSQLDESVVTDLGLMPGPGDGVVQRQWFNWLREIYGEPPAFEEYRYYVYRSETGPQG